MILTYKISHNFHLQNEFEKARQVADFAIKNRDKLSSKEVKHIGLKSVISNQILRKYGRNKKCKSISKVNLIIPGQCIKLKNNMLRLVPLGLEVDIRHLPTFKKVNQVEISKSFVYVSVEVSEVLAFSPTAYVGLDRNVTQHVAVLANPSNGNVLKLGKSCLHLRNKYKALRSKAQQKRQFKFVKKLGKRENNILKNLDHQISSKIIKYCVENKAGLVLEGLKGIRNKKSKGKKINGMLHSWSFYQLETFLKYKALRNGVSIFKVDPRYTSQQCSKCGHIGIREGKKFSCQNCKHFDHADANAAFCIAKKHDQSDADRDVSESLPIFPDYEKINTDEAQKGNA